MSQLILDDQLDLLEVLPPMRKWITVARLREVQPRQIVLDDRVPEILLTLKRPTFVTIDHHFWNRYWCHLNYCVLYFWLRDIEQVLIPGMLRTLLHLAEFRTRASRMGKVVRVGKTAIDYWEYKAPSIRRISWKRPGRRSR
jgi:hypothetical protein